MANVLSDEKRQQVEALRRLGWSLRRIERELGVRRETASAYLKAAGVGVRGQGGARAKPATSREVITDPAAAKPATPGPVITDPRPTASPTASSCESRFRWFLVIGRWISPLGCTSSRLRQSLLELPPEVAAPGACHKRPNDHGRCSNTSQSRSLWLYKQCCSQCQSPDSKTPRQTRSRNYLDHGKQPRAAHT